VRSTHVLLAGSRSHSQAAIDAAAPSPGLALLSWIGALARFASEFVTCSRGLWGWCFCVPRSGGQKLGRRWGER
jgi:hypothetical protein